MTGFADQLRELRERATKGPWETHPCSNGGCLLVRGDRFRASTQMIPEADPEFIVFLANHAAEIEKLVRAASELRSVQIDPQDPADQKYVRLLAALEALNKESGND